MTNRPTSRFLLCLLLVALLSNACPAAAQRPTPGPTGYARSGERMVTIQPSLRYRTHLYQVHYFTTGSYNTSDLKFFFIASPKFFDEQKITAVLVTEDGRIVEDEETQRTVLLLYRTCYYLYQNPNSGNLGPIDDSFADDFGRVTHNPLFIEQWIKSWFSSRSTQVTEALRSILTAQVNAPEDVRAFGDEVRQRAEAGKTVLDAVDQTLEAARFSNNRAVRNAARDVRDIFKSWQPVTEQTTSYVKIGGSRIELFNALEILSLSARLIWAADLQRERADWLRQFDASAEGSARLDAEQRSATGVVLVEVENNWAQRANIILQFVNDQAVDLAIRLTTDALAREWVQWSWKTLGKRTAGHLLAGVASAGLLGLTLGDLLYGLDDLHMNFLKGERADELRRHFRDGRLALQQQAAGHRGETCDGELAARYRSAYMLESLAAAEVYRSYAAGVLATVGKPWWIELFNPVNWLRGKEWRTAAEGIKAMGDAAEKQAEDDMGHPAFVDAGVTLAHSRLVAPPSSYNAKSSGALVYDIVLPGETARLALKIQNAGEATWAGPQDTLAGTTDNPANAPRMVPLPSQVRPGETITCTISFATTGLVGVQRIHYQMQHNGQPFGDALTGLVIVLPSQLKDLEDRLRRQIDEWQRQGQQTVDELIASIQAAIQREVERQAQNLLDQILAQLEILIKQMVSQCGGALVLGMGAVLFVRRQQIH